MKKFLYKDNFNRTTEVNSYEPSDYISTYTGTPSVPIITNLSGYIDSSFIPAVSAAASLEVARVASVPIARGDVVYSVSATHVAIATNNSTLDKAIVLGIALDDAIAGESVRVLLLGAISDVIFSAFTVNNLLYLDEDGGLTDAKPGPGTFLAPVAKALGNNQILVSVTYPTKLE